MTCVRFSLERWHEQIPYRIQSRSLFRIVTLADPFISWPAHTLRYMWFSSRWTNHGGRPDRTSLLSFISTSLMICQSTFLFSDRELDHSPPFVTASRTFGSDQSPSRSLPNMINLFLSSSLFLFSLLCSDLLFGWPRNESTRHYVFMSCVLISGSSIPNEYFVAVAQLWYPTLFREQAILNSFLLLLARYQPVCSDLFVTHQSNWSYHPSFP